MTVRLSFKVGERKLYLGEARIPQGGGTLTFGALILAYSEEEAEAKLKEYASQEHPSLEWDKISYRTSLCFVII